MIPNQIELAARAIDPAAWRPGYEELFAERRADSLRMAKDALNAALPGLFTDPPQVWLAPWEPTEAMVDAVYFVTEDDDGTRESYVTMRDAHLASQSDKPEKGEAE